MDIYGTAVTLNVAGEDAVKTYTGTLLTILTYLIICAYSLLLLITFVTRANPNVMTTFVQSKFDHTNVVSWKETGFKFAWAAVSHDDRMEPKNNASFANWQPILRAFDGMKNTEAKLGFHLCTPLEIDSFDSIDPSYTDVFSHFRSKPTLNCLDDNDIKIFGQDTTKFQRVDFNLLPCSTCNVSLQQVKDYLGPVKLVLLHNKPYFDQSKYDKQKIVKRSTISQFTLNL